ncbi:MAG: hypothetical protein PHR35_14425, partial [Kiritimatiellae bacterium]|nr:hypothetical protein [Kiritimatiellia bacterium]
MHSARFGCGRQPIGTVPACLAWLIFAVCGLQGADRAKLPESRSAGALDSGEGGLRESGDAGIRERNGGLRETQDSGALESGNGGLRETGGRGLQDSQGVLASSDAGGGASPESSRLKDLRAKQAAELDSLRNTYDHRARTECPRNRDGTINKNSAEYKNLVGEYTDAHEAVRQKHLADLPPDKVGKGVQNTGSKRKDVRSDGDYTASDDASYDGQKKDWEGRGHSVKDKGYKAVNESTDESLWKSDPDGKYRDAKIKDPDAMGTPGGQKSVGDKRGITDAEGMTLDHEKKYLDGKERGNLKDQAKAVNKAGEKTGRAASDPDGLYAKNRALQQYGDDVTAGITDLGDSPAERQRKLDDFQKANDAEMERIKAEGKAQGERGQRNREQVRDQTRKTETAGDEAWNKAKNDANYDGQKTTSEAIDDRIKQVNDANRATAEQNKATRERLEGGTARADTPDGKPRVDADAPGGPRVDADTPGGPKVDGPDGPHGAAKPGKMGKAMEAAGKGMEAVDILATAEDAKTAIQEGDMKKLRGTLAEGADGLVGSPVATGKMVKDRLVDAHGDKNDAQARAAAAEANEQQMRLDLLREGYSKENVDKIMDAHEKGDDGPLKAGYAKIGKEIPKPVETDPTIGESLSNYGSEVVENAGEVYDGLKERGAKAGKLVKGAAEDVSEIGAGLTEKGVVDQIRENQKDNWTGNNLAAGADHIYEKGKEAVGIKSTDGEREDQAAKDLADKLIEKGVDPGEAREAAERVIQHPGDKDAATHMRDLVREADPATKMVEKGVDPKEAREAADRMRQNPNSAEARSHVRDLIREAQEQKGKDGKAGKGGKAGDVPKQVAKEKPDKAPDVEKTAGTDTAESDDGRSTSERGAVADDGEPRNDAGQKVDAGAYGEGDRIVTADGREFERKDGHWSATGENYGAYKGGGGGLKDSEPAAAESGNEAAGTVGAGNALDGFVGGREGRAAANGAAANGLMSGQHDLADAAKAGDQAGRDARQAVNSAGQDARDTQSKSSAQTAAANRETSLGKAVADGLQQGVEKGLTSAGEAFGSKAADKVNDKIYGDGHKQDQPESDGKGTGGGAAGGGGQDKGGKPPHKAGVGDGGGKDRGDGHGSKGEGRGGKGDGKPGKSDGSKDGDERGGSKSGDGDGSGDDSGPTVTCPGCGASIKGVAG